MLATASSKISFGLKPNNKKTSVVYRALLKRYHDLNKGNYRSKRLRYCFGDCAIIIRRMEAGGPLRKTHTLREGGKISKFLFEKQGLWPEGYGR